MRVLFHCIAQASKASNRYPITKQCIVLCSLLPPKSGRVEPPATASSHQPLSQSNASFEAALRGDEARYTWDNRSYKIDFEKMEQENIQHGAKIP